MGNLDSHAPKTLSLHKLPDAERQWLLDMAGMIATAAGCLDWVGRKETVMTDKLLAEAKAHAEALNNIAAYLAGSRVSEIYGPDDPPTDVTGKEVAKHE